MGTSYDHLDDSIYSGQALGAATASIKTTPGRLRSVYVSNRNAATRYFLIFNSTGATTTIYASFPIPLAASGIPLNLGELELGAGGMKLSVGITFGISTSSSTYSAATSTEHDIYARYV